MSEPLNASYPVLPLRDIVVFPHMIVPLFRGPRKIGARAGRGDGRTTSRYYCPARWIPVKMIQNAAGIYKTGVLANVLQLA